MNGVLVSLSGFMVSLDVYVDMAGAAINVPLDFGPFDSKMGAFRWLEAIEEVHAKRKLSEAVIAEEIFDSNGFPTRPYIDFHLSVPTIAQSPLVRKYKDRLLSPGKAEEVEPRIAEYAIRAASQRTAYACHLLDTKGG